MPTKTNAQAGRTHIESSNVSQTVKVDSNWTGTAIELLRALEETDEEIERLEVGTDLGSPKVTVYRRHGTQGEEGPVPDALHDKLAEYDYEHVGQTGATYSHTDARAAHVYTK